MVIFGHLERYKGKQALFLTWCPDPFLGHLILHVEGIIHEVGYPKKQVQCRDVGVFDRFSLSLG